MKPEVLMVIALNHCVYTVAALNHCVYTVCSQFDTFIKFSVEVLADMASPVVSHTSTSQQCNAFSVLNAPKKQLTLGDNGLLFCANVKDKRDRMYNDMIGLVRKMGIYWTDPIGAW